MRHFKIKVCGLTRASDASLAARLGADMVGVIFARKSPRFVGKRDAARILSAIPATVARVGVFVNEDIDRILKTAATLRLDFAQLHGDETAADIKALRREGLRVIRAFPVERQSDWKRLLTCKADLVLADNRAAGKPGGTGEAFNWSLKPPRALRNLVLAGGLNSDNVAAGVCAMRPLVVDVNSGVESSPGVKSLSKLKRFFKMCNELRYEN